MALRCSFHCPECNEDESIFFYDSEDMAQCSSCGYFFKLCMQPIRVPAKKIKCDSCARKKLKDMQLCHMCKSYPTMSDFYMEDTVENLAKLKKELDSKTWVCMRCGYNGKGKEKHDCVD